MVDSVGPDVAGCVGDVTDGVAFFKMYFFRSFENVNKMENGARGGCANRFGILRTSSCANRLEVVDGKIFQIIFIFNLTIKDIDIRTLF